jgi:hypothetical protein
MKERIETVVDDVFSVLLFGLPQGTLFGVVWCVYGTGHAKHARRCVDSVLQPLEIEMNEWTVGEHASKFPRLFA